MRNRLRYFFVVPLLALVSNAFALNFHHLAPDKNVLIHYDHPKGSQEQMKMMLMARLLRLLSEELDMQHTNIVLFHNMTAWGSFNQYSSEEEKENTPVPNLTVGYEYFHQEHMKKAGPAVCIYYNGETDIEKMIEVTCYALTHIEDIKRKQKLPNRGYDGFRDRKRYYVDDTDLDIKYGGNDITKKILSQSRLSLCYFIYPEIDWYYSDKQYHIIKRNVPNNDTITKFSFIAPAKGIELLSLKDVIHIARFTANDYLVFDAFDNFYHLDINKAKVSGPFKTLGWPGDIIDSYVNGDELVMNLPYSDYYSRDIKCTIKFNRETQKVTSDELKISLLMASNMWPYIDPTYDYHSYYTSSEPL